MTAALDRLARSLADHYRIDGELGRGGMATVYSAEDLKHHRQVAIKVLSPEMAGVVSFDRFLREIEIAARLSHPHILPLFDSGLVTGQLYYVMPHIEGESLRTRIDRERQLPIDEALRLAREIASALGYAHHHGVVHRDIKPENVLLSEGIALVADFGIARAVSTGAPGKVTTTGVVLGTALYMSPEQAAGAVDVDARSDLYSLGCVLYEMLAGEPPFTGSSALVVCSRHAFDAVPPLETRRPGVPESLARYVEKTLSKNPADRYPTAAQFAEALSAAVSGVPTSTPRLPGRGLAIPNNLPKVRTRFIGRESELPECTRLLTESQLLTLTGSGGCGKTRLALKLAETQLESYPDGVWFIDLGPVAEESRVAEAVALALEVREEPGTQLTETLNRYVRAKRMLLVLDNCEHLLEASGAVVDALLAAGDGVRVLVTSRESLGIRGEQQFALPALGIPPAETARDLDAVRSSEAVMLFVDRARMAHREFALDEGSAPAVAEICRRLDGIPLAIELAAARVRMLSVEEIRTRLDDRFRLLTGGDKTLPRQQTLRATFQWSYDLLTDEEQRFFRSLAVFAGGWTLEAATAVACDDADEFEVLELMTRLAGKSLVRMERIGVGPSRYWMLETLRQFAEEKLNEAGETKAARERHLRYFLAWLEEREAIVGGAELGRWLTEVEREHENVLSALDSCARAEGGAEQALRLADKVYLYWNNRGMYGVCRERLGAVLRLPGAEAPTLARAGVLACMGDVAWKQGALAEARACLEESLTLSRNAGDARSIVGALNGLGTVSIRENDPGAAHACFEEALALARELREGRLIGQGLNNLAHLAYERGDLAQARALWEDALGLARALGNPWNVAVVLGNLTYVALRSGAWEEVRGNLSRALPIVRDLGLRSLAESVLRQSSALAAAMGDATRAARWYGAAAALEHAIGSRRYAHSESLHATIEACVRETLGDPAFERARAEGLALGYEVALREALGWLESNAEPSSALPA